MKVGDIFYCIFLFSLVAIFLLIYFLIRKKDKTYQFKFLLIWCFINFSLHFLKQLVYLDVNMLRKSTAENICAISTLIFPFIMMSKNKNSWFKDFMYFIGIIGGFAGLVYPTEVLGENILRFETFRFYFCHFSLFAIPLLLALFDIQKPKLKALLYIPIIFLVYQLIICANTAILCFSGLVSYEGYTPFELFLSSELMNNSFTFGPTSDMGDVGKFIGSLCPSFMKIDIFNINGGNTTYWPCIWLLIPGYVLFTPLYLLISFPFYISRCNKLQNTK